MNIEKQDAEELLDKLLTTMNYGRLSMAQLEQQMNITIDTFKRLEKLFEEEKDFLQKKK